MKQSGNRNIKFQKISYQKWSHGDWVIFNNGIDYSIENKKQNCYAHIDSLKNARDYVTCKVLGIDWLEIGSRELLKKIHKLIIKGVKL